MNYFFANLWQNANCPLITVYPCTIYCAHAPHTITDINILFARASLPHVMLTFVYRNRTSPAAIHRFRVVNNKRLRQQQQQQKHHQSNIESAFNRCPCWGLWFIHQTPAEPERSRNPSSSRAQGIFVCSVISFVRRNTFVCLCPGTKDAQTISWESRISSD